MKWTRERSNRFRDRRRYVADLLAQGITINHKMMIEIGQSYGVSSGAVRSDIYILQRPKGLPPASVSPSTKRFVRRRDGSVCQYCGCRIDRHSGIVIEHVVPIAQNGVGRPYNLVVACWSCNSAKGSSVWIPSNLDVITVNHPEWRKLILEKAREIGDGNASDGIRKALAAWS